MMGQREYQKLLTTVGSTAAVIGVGAAVAANSIPAMAVVAAAGGAVAAGALYAKLKAESEKAPKAR
jgi:hypothetical protein